MCGIAGVLLSEAMEEAELNARLSAMTERLAHRGPDDRGSWSDSLHGIGLGFRRLAVIDLSQTGSQPMQSGSRRYVIVFNGEIYNFRELRSQLFALGHRFRGLSDTEVLVQAVEEWGVRAAAKKARGMFAFAVWDREERRLSLVRDRMGIKPLYVYRDERKLLFGSELKAILAWPEVDLTLDEVAVQQLVDQLWIAPSRSIFRAITKVPAGKIISIDGDGLTKRCSTFWDLQRAAAIGRSNLISGSNADVVDQFEDLLRESVRLHLHADVPVGMFLSGGLDSSLVTAIAQEVCQGALRTFTVGFETSDFNESRHAASVAASLGTDHTEIRLSESDILGIVPDLPNIHDEPMADPSQLPTVVLSREVRRKVTVALSGDGGDELFGGYNRYRLGGRLLEWRESRLLRGLSKLGHVVPVPVLERLPLGVLGLGTQVDPSVALSKLLGVLSADDETTAYLALLSPGAVDSVPDYAPVDSIMSSTTCSLLSRMLLTDQLTYLSEDLLAKVDRASMHHSLEVRLPLLDHRIVEFSWRLGDHYKIRSRRTKWLLRTALERRLSRNIIDRPKMGFTVPIVDWLSGPLRAWVNDIISGAGDWEGRVSVGPKETLRRFSQGERHLALRLWAWAVFGAWRKKWVRG